MNQPIYLTYFDTAMVLLEVGSLRIVTDPVLDREGTAFHYGPVHLEKVGATVDPADFGRVDAVLLSHDQHGDNLDNAGRAFAATVPRIVTTPLAASRMGNNTLGLEPWRETELVSPDGFSLRVTAMPAQHGPDGTEDATGPVTGFLLEWTGQSGGPIYISGDTVPFSGTEEIVRRISPPSLALLHIGRVQLAPFGNAQLSLSAQQAADYAIQLNAAAVIPIHYEGWRHFTEARTEAAAVMAAHPVANRIHWPEKGQRYRL